MIRQTNSEIIQIKDEVTIAINEKKPVLAFESAIITHGIPYPRNIELVEKCLRICQSNNVVAATIGVLNGKIIVGLTFNQIQQLATDSKAQKIGKRELALAVQSQASGGTTVSATITVAQMAKIALFVTGGIGGVHHNAENTFDISADLPAIAQTQVAIICTGAKAILDIPLTLEYLETQSVPIVGYKSDYFPVFYSDEKKYKLQFSYNSASEIAQLLTSKWKLEQSGGILITNPCPPDKVIDANIIDRLIKQAVSDLGKSSFTGQDVTPHFLKAITEKTAGRSLAANEALVENNCQLGIKIAQAMAKLTN